jgi:hypothetical protein
MLINKFKFVLHAHNLFSEDIHATMFEIEMSSETMIFGPLLAIRNTFYTTLHALLFLVLNKNTKMLYFIYLVVIYVFLKYCKC